MKAMTADDVARELGRTTDWLLRNYERLVTEKRLPPPLVESGGLTWSAAQFYAVIDRPLTREQRALAAAFRAATEAALQPVDIDALDEVARSRARLDARFAR